MIDPEELFLSSFKRSLIAGFLVGGLVALALAVALSRAIVRSIAALTAAARGMASGSLDQRVTMRQGGETGELGHAFNAIAEGLTRTETATPRDGRRCDAAGLNWVRGAVYATLVLTSSDPNASSNVPRAWLYCRSGRLDTSARGW